MAEIQIQSEIEKLKDLASNGIDSKELDEAKSILEVIKSSKASKTQLEEIIKILDREVKNFPAGNFVAVNILNGQKEDFENLLVNYNEEKQSITDESSDSANEVKGTITKSSEISNEVRKRYNEKHIKTYSRRINTVLGKLDENDKAQKEIKEALANILISSSDIGVRNLQDLLISSGAKINSDGFFGPKTMKALEKIVGIKTVESHASSSKHKKGAPLHAAAKQNPEQHTKNPAPVMIKPEAKTIEIKHEIAQNIKASDGSIISGDFIRNEKGVRTLYNGTRKYPDGRVMIYKEGKEVSYTMEYMALMAVMVGVDLAGFTGVGTIPSLIAGTGYDIYDLTQKEDAGWQALKKMGLVDKRYYAGDKGILEYSLNALGLIPGMTAVAKGYQIQKFYKGLSAAEQAEFSRIESFIKDRFFGIGEVAAKKGQIGHEYSREANDLKKAREKAAKEKKKTTKKTDRGIVESTKTASNGEKIISRKGSYRIDGEDYIWSKKQGLFVDKKTGTTKYTMEEFEKLQIEKAPRLINKTTEHISSKGTKATEETIETEIKASEEILDNAGNISKFAKVKFEGLFKKEIKENKSITVGENTYKKRADGKFEIEGDDILYSQKEILAKIKDEDKIVFLQSRAKQNIANLGEETIKLKDGFFDFAGKYKVSKNEVLIKDGDKWRKITNEAELNKFYADNFEELLKKTKGIDVNKVAEDTSKTFLSKLGDTKLGKMGKATDDFMKSIPYGPGKLYKGGKYITKGVFNEIITPYKIIKNFKESEGFAESTKSILFGDKNKNWILPNGWDITKSGVAKVGAYTVVPQVYEMILETNRGEDMKISPANMATNYLEFMYLGVINSMILEYYGVDEKLGLGESKKAA